MGGGVIMEVEGATRDGPHSLVWTRTAFQADPLARQALNANLKEPFESRHQGGLREWQECGIQQGVPAAGSQGGPGTGTGQEPGHPPTGGPTTASRSLLP